MPRKLSKIAQKVLDRMKGPELVMIGKVPINNQGYTKYDFLGVSVLTSRDSLTVLNGSGVTVYLTSNPWAEKEEMYPLGPGENMHLTGKSGTLYCYAAVERKSEGLPQRPLSDG